MIESGKDQKVKMKKKFRICSSSFARLRAPVKKPEDQRSRSSRTSWWIVRGVQLSSWSRTWLDTTTDADTNESGNSAPLYFEKMVYVDEGRTDEPGSLPHFFFFFDQGFNVEVLHRFRGIPWHPNSEFKRICFSSRLCILCSFFLPIDVTTHCREKCPSAHFLQSARHNRITCFFFAGLWPLHSRLQGEAADWRWLTFPECVMSCHVTHLRVDVFFPTPCARVCVHIYVYMTPLCFVLPRSSTARDCAQSALNCPLTNWDAWSDLPDTAWL